MKKLLAIFVFSFVLNFLWEHAHAPLYALYQGGPLTDYILLHAALGDAVIITVIGALFIYFPSVGRRHWLVWPIGLGLAVFIELLALHAGRWEYAATMPIIPLLNTGLTPTIQLALTGWATLKIILWKKNFLNVPRRAVAEKLKK